MYEESYLKRESFLSLGTILGILLVVAGLVVAVITATAPLPFWAGYIALAVALIGATLIAVGWPRGWTLAALGAHVVGLVLVVVGLAIAQYNGGVYTQAALVTFWIGVGLASAAVIAGLVAIAVYAYYRSNGGGGGKTQHRYYIVQGKK